MTDGPDPLLVRIAEALERLAPKPPPEPDFTAGRLHRYEAATGEFHPAPDYGLAVELLVGVDSQKARFVENLRRFAEGLPYNHALLWGVRGTGKSSLSKAAFMDLTRTHPQLRLVEIDRDHVSDLPALFDRLRGIRWRRLEVATIITLSGGPETPPSSADFSDLAAAAPSSKERSSHSTTNR